MRWQLISVFVSMGIVTPALGSKLADPACFGLVKTMNIVAHEDDDLLFLSPDLLHDIQSGRCVRTVYVTAGDDNKGIPYVESREDGIREAYALMAMQPEAFEPSPYVVADRTLQVLHLHGLQRVSLIFLHLPDGDFSGDGFAQNHYQSLRKLTQGEIPSIDPVDGSASYTLDSLKQVLSTLVTDFEPDIIRAQDSRPYVADHSDHKAVASLVLQIDYRHAHTLVTYADYITIAYEENLSITDSLEKEAVFGVYAKQDREIGAYTSEINPYYYWLKRQYVVSNTVTGTARTKRDPR